MKRLFRILYINPQSKISGAEVAMLNLMENLDQSVFKPVLLCKENGPLVERCAERGIENFFLPSLPSSNSQVWNTYRSILFNAFWIARLNKRIHIDLVHSNSPRMAYHAGLAARLSGTRSITHVRDYSNSPFQSPIKSYFLNLVSDRFIAISQAVFNALTNWAPYVSQKTEIIYDGINEPVPPTISPAKSIRQELNIDPAAKIIGVVGALNSLKGQSVAIQAMSDVHKRQPNIYLIIVGAAFDSQGEIYFHQLQAHVQELGLSQCVRFIGQRDDIYSIMSEIDILVHSPVLPEALGLVLLEASMLKKPIIASRIGGIPEVIHSGETGYLFSPGNSDELADAIIHLVNSPSEGVRLGQQAFDFVRQQFSMTQYINKIQSIYQKYLI